MVRRRRKKGGFLPSLGNPAGAILRKLLGGRKPLVKHSASKKSKPKRRTKTKRKKKGNLVAKNLKVKGGIFPPSALRFVARKVVKWSRPKDQEKFWNSVNKKFGKKK